MATPVGGVDQAATFGGLTGYKRDAPSRPTSVPGGLPAFRGRTNTPGDQVRAPTIRASYNRQWKGSNALIPYARVVPLHHLEHVGRVAPGDVVFCSTHRVNRAWVEPNTPGFNAPAGGGAPIPLSGDRVATPTRLVGIDWLNKQLGGRVEYDAGAYATNWQVGENVILGSPVPNLATGVPPSIGAHPISDNVADEWRSLPLLREWACDGIVLSNDTPDCHTSNGTRDGQLFNIGVQGVCHVNNGYGTLAAHSNRTHRSINSRLSTLPCSQLTSRAVASSRRTARSARPRTGTTTAASRLCTTPSWTTRATRRTRTSRCRCSTASCGPWTRCTWGSCAPSGR